MNVRPEDIPPLTPEEEEEIYAFFPDERVVTMTETLTELTPEMFGYPDEDATGPDFVELTLNHRCDRCGAAAVAQVEISESVPHLLFCGHHWRANLDKIKDAGYAYDVPEEHDFVHTWRSHDEKPWANELRDAGSAV